MGQAAIRRSTRGKRLESSRTGQDGASVHRPMVRASGTGSTGGASTIIMSKLSRLRDQVAEPVVLQQPAGIDARVAAGREEMKPPPRRGRSSSPPRAWHLAAGHVNQAGLVGDVEHPGEGRVAEVGIDEQGHQAGIDAALGELRREGGLAFAAAGAGDQDAMAVAAPGIGAGAGATR